MRRRARRGVEQIGLSFLDAIFCGFGAIVLLFVLTKAAEPQVIEQTTEDLEALVARLEQELVELNDESRVLTRELKHREEQLARDTDKVARLKGDLTKIEGQYSASKRTAAVQNILEGKLVAAQQTLTEEMRRLLASQPPPTRRDRSVGGIQGS